jgi:hypothetical protein
MKKKKELRDLTMQANGTCHLLGQRVSTRFKEEKPLKRAAPLERFPAIRPTSADVFGEYLGHSSLNPSYHESGLSKSYGLIEFHYDTMRRSAIRRAEMGMTDIPEKPAGAIPGYSGFVPRRDACNVHGGTYAKCNGTANDLHSTLRKEVGFKGFPRSSSSPSLSMTR